MLSINVSIMKKNYLLFVIAIFHPLTFLFSQSGSVSAGGEAVGSGGSMSFSIGQVDYNTITGAGTLAQGLQQPYEASSITLLSFAAQVNIQKKVDINWITSLEINSAYFTVERSKDAIHFEDVIKVSGAGNSSSLLKYQTVDNAPYSGRSYYRLKQVDLNGQFKYSKVVAVTISDLGEQFTVYPNPTPDVVILNVQNSTEIENMSYAVYDIQSNLIMHQKKLSGVQTLIYMGTLANATYIIKVFNKTGEIKNFKVIKNK